MFVCAQTKFFLNMIQTRSHLCNLILIIDCFGNGIHC